MLIDEFFLQSLGKWNAMRSGHSLAFKEFEDIRSKLQITSLDRNDSRVLEIVKNNKLKAKEYKAAFIIEWEAESDWLADDKTNYSYGSSILVPIEVSESDGYILRSKGYSESISALSKYNILEDGTLILSTRYNQTIAEERIWFISENVRCRSSVIRGLHTSAILQTSYSSEIKLIS